MRQTRFRTTITGSYPRPQHPENTVKKPTLSREEADELIRWAVRDQVDAGPLRALVFGAAQLRERSASESPKTAAKQ